VNAATQTLNTWHLDQYGALNLYTRTLSGALVHVWLTARPVYCDRGHWQLNIEASGTPEQLHGHDSGIGGLDGSDAFPRFFMDLETALHETEDFLRWRIWKIPRQRPSLTRFDGRTFDPKEMP
jgi:hypothetical protein